MKRRTSGAKSAKRVPGTPTGSKKTRISRGKRKTKVGQGRVRKGVRKDLFAPGKGSAARRALPEPYASGLVPPAPGDRVGDVVHVAATGETKTRPSRATVGPDRVASEIQDGPEGKFFFARDPRTSHLYDEWATRRLEIADALTLDILQGLAGETLTRELCDQVRDRCRKAVLVATGLASVAVAEIDRAARAFKVRGPQEGQPEIDAEIFAAIEATGRGVINGSIALEGKEPFRLSAEGLRKGYYRHKKRLPDLKEGQE